MIRASVALLAAASATSGSWSEIVPRVNTQTSRWIAAAPSRFTTVDDARPLLGAFLRGDARFEETGPELDEPEADDLPESFDAREAWPRCRGMRYVMDQSACGDCWAFASVESFQDRLCAATGEDVRLSAEDTAFCSYAGHGCSGGNSAWQWFQRVGVVTGDDFFGIGSGKSCKPYSLQPCAHDVPTDERYNTSCFDVNVTAPSCISECSETAYSLSYAEDKLKADSAWSLKAGATKKIQTTLVNHGPLYAAFEVYDDFLAYKSGVYHKTAGASALGGHAVELIGWGTDPQGGDYWLLKNSWNEMWGDGGFFKIARGVDECQIESHVNGGKVSGPSTTAEV